MSRTKRNRIYWRNRGGEECAYGDFRDIGGSREALIPKGEKRATRDPDIAAQLVADRVAELEGRKRSKAILGLEARVALKPYVAAHLTAKALAGSVTEKTLVTAERHLRAAIDFFGADTLLDEITVADVDAWRNALAQTRGGSAQRHHLNDLSNLYKRAHTEKVVLPGYNPVSAMMDKPSAATAEAKWLEVQNAALLLESARTGEPPRPEITRGTSTRSSRRSS